MGIRATVDAKVMLFVGILLLAVALSVVGCRKAASIQPVRIGEAVIDPPIEINYASIFSDGGTTAVRLTSAKGKSFSMCFDNRIGSETPGRIYFGADHPTRPGAKLIAEGSGEETALLGLLTRWLDSHYSSDRQKALRDRVSIEGLSGQELCALRILWAISGQERVGEMRQRLNERYTAEEQKRLLNLTSPADLNEADKLAWEHVQALHGYPAHRQK